MDGQTCSISSVQAVRTGRPRPYFEADPVLQDHRSLRRPQVGLGQAPVAVGDGEGDGDGAEGALLGDAHHGQRGHALPGPRGRRGLLQQRVAAAVEGQDAVAVVAGQDVHRRYGDRRSNSRTPLQRVTGAARRQRRRVASGRAERDRTTR